MSRRWPAVLSVINAFGQERRQLSLSDVARATSLPKASVRRMLHTLITLQLADTDGRVFRLTPRVLESRRRLSRLEQDLDRGPAGVRAHRARDRTVAWVAVLDGHDMVTIAHALPHYPMELSPGVGVAPSRLLHRRRPRHPRHLRRGRARSLAVGAEAQGVHQIHADQPQGDPQDHHRRARQGLRRDAPGHEDRRLRTRRAAQAL